MLAVQCSGAPGESLGVALDVLLLCIWPPQSNIGCHSSKRTVFSYVVDAKKPQFVPKNAACRMSIEQRAKDRGRLIHYMVLQLLTLYVINYEIRQVRGSTNTAALKYCSTFGSAFPR